MHSESAMKYAGNSAPLDGNCPVFLSKTATFVVNVVENSSLVIIEGLVVTVIIWYC